MAGVNSSSAALSELMRLPQCIPRYTLKNVSNLVKILLH